MGTKEPPRFMGIKQALSAVGSVIGRLLGPLASNKKHQKTINPKIMTKNAVMHDHIVQKSFADDVLAVHTKVSTVAKTLAERKTVGREPKTSAPVNTQRHHKKPRS